MIYLATITSQGQITIPAKVRKALQLHKSSKVLIKVENNKATIEPEPDIMDLAGILHKYAKKNKSIDEITELEKQTIGDAIIEKYKRKLENSGPKLLIIKP